MAGYGEQKQDLENKLLRENKKLRMKLNEIESVCNSYKAMQSEYATSTEIPYWDIMNIIEEYNKGTRLMSNIIYTKQDFDSVKRQLAIVTRDLELAHLELEKRKVKKACGNCSGGCVASEITGMPCSPK